MRPREQSAANGDQLAAPLFRPLRGNQKKPLDTARGMNSDAINCVVPAYAVSIGLDARPPRAHLMPAAFIATALENRAALEDLQKEAGRRYPSTTKLNDRRGYNPEKAANFFATY